MIRKYFPMMLSGRVGIPCMWEEGGRSQSGGYSLLIADQKAEKPRAIYIPRTPKPCGQHAMIPIKPAYFIIETSVSGRDDCNTATQIWRVLEIVDLHITAELIQEYFNGAWSVLYAPIKEEVDRNINGLITAAWNKARDRDRPKPYWATEPSHYKSRNEGRMADEK